MESQSINGYLLLKLKLRKPMSNYEEHISKVYDVSEAELKYKTPQTKSIDN